MNIEHQDRLSGYSTLVHLLRRRGVQQPERRAFTFLRDGEKDEVHITWGALDRGAQAVAALLQRHAREGDRALLLYPSGLEYITAFLGCLYAAVIAVPAYPPTPGLERTMGRLRTIVSDAGPTVVLTTTSITAIGSELAAHDPAFAGIRWIATDAAGEAEAETWQEPDIDGAALAFLQYTSGSTRAPKGVMVSHRNLMHNQALTERVMALDEDSIGVSWLPLYHDMGLIGTILQPVYTGFYTVFMSPMRFIQRPARWLRAIDRYRGTVCAGPNFAFDLCSRQIKPDEIAGLDLSSWRIAFNGAEPVRPETLDRFTRAFEAVSLRREALSPCYGLAEATLLVSVVPVAAPPLVVHADKSALQRGQVTIMPGPDTRLALALAGSGQVPPGQRVLIVDPVTRLCCPPGRVGEIWVAGASVAQGYWNLPEATADTFRARLADSGEGPFLRTGDLGFIHDEQLFVTGRLKDLIIIRGSNYAPQDIEHTAGASHPALRPDCGIAFTIEAGADPQLVIVHEVLREHSSVDREEVASAIRKAVAEEHELAVHAVVLVRTGTVPKTSSGKLQRHACRDQYRDGALGQAWESVRPANVSREPRHAAAGEQPAAGRSGLLRRLDAASPGNRRRVLAAYVDEQARLALGLDPQIPLDPRRPLSELGLDSLMAIELRSRLSSAAGQVLPETLLFDYPTAEGLAGYLASEVLNLASGGATNDHGPTGNASSAPGEGARDSRAVDVEQLSDEEVEAVLAEELAAVQALLSKDQS